MKVVVPPAHTYLDPITVDVPLPPSTNRIWRRGVSKTTRKAFTYLDPSYARWKGEADTALMHQRLGRIWGPITGAFEVHLTITKAKRYKADIDNRIKAVVDWAKQAGLIAEDKWQDAVHIAWGEVPMGARLTLKPVEFSP